MSAWQIYRDMYPDLTVSLRTEQDAKRHFIQYGRNEGRLWVDNLPWTIANFATIYAPCFAGLQGIETGGPSDVFKDAVPVYRLARRVDGCNFATRTMWEDNLKEGQDYRSPGTVETGRQFICEARSVPVADATYDFLLSSHCLEHSANPLAVMREAKRLVRSGGHLLFILPWKEACFDHGREVTPLAHLVDDERADMGEDDLSHLDEWVERIDIVMTGLPSRDFLRRRDADNLANRGMHHHVFDLALLQQMVQHVGGLQILHTDLLQPFHQVMLLRKR